jgi:acyl-homoserine lactone acylase PvdQ
MPQVVNPKSGYIVGCNQQVVPLSFRHLVGTAMPTTGRSYRVNEILRELVKNDTKLDLEFMKKMQVENYDAVARELCKLLIPFTRKHAEVYFTSSSTEGKAIKQLLDILKNWDYVANEDSSGPLIFYMWLKEIMDGYLHEQIPNPITRRVIVQINTKEQFIGKWIEKWNKGEGLDHLYCKNKETKGKINPCAYNIVNSLVKVKQNIVARFGNAEKNWKWGYHNIVRSISDAFSSTPLRLFFDRAYLSYVIPLYDL